MKCLKCGKEIEDVDENWYNCECGWHFLKVYYDNLEDE